MQILAGLGIALVAAVAIACAVLSLSNLYVGQFSLGLGLLVGAFGLGAPSYWAWDRFLKSIQVDDGAPDASPTATPNNPAWLISFWLLLLTAVLVFGAFEVTGLARWLNLGTALCLAVTGVGVALAARRKPTQPNSP